MGLTFGIIPKKLRSTIFDSSRRIMGFSIMVLPIATITSFSPRFLNFSRDWGTLIHLTSVYIIAVFVAISFLSLLGDKRLLGSAKFIRTILGCFLFPIPLTSAIIYGDHAIINIATTITSVILLTTIVYESVTFYILYQNGVKRVNNYYSDDIAVNIKWLHNSALFMLSIGLISGIHALVPNTPIWCNFIITLYRGFVFLFVFFSFMRFIKSFANMESSIPNHNPLIEFEHELYRTNNRGEVKITIDNEIRDAIGEKLNIWIEEMNYTKKNITLQSLSEDISTNRSYLSYYINETFKCSFKVWITKLRITQAKKLLTHCQELSISDVANTVGFLSTNSFAHAFKHLEGVAPNRWRSHRSRNIEKAQAK